MDKQVESFERRRFRLDVVVWADACIPPPPPDLECSDIDERRFTVLPPDPHNFDGDHNGIGCEEP